MTWGLQCGRVQRAPFGTQAPDEESERGLEAMEAYKFLDPITPQMCSTSTGGGAGRGFDRAPCRIDQRVLVRALSAGGNRQVADGRVLIAPDGIDCLAGQDLHAEWLSTW